MLVFIIVFIILLLIYSIVLYNSLIYKKNQFDNAFSTVDVILQKRSDLIPRLVTLAQMYMQFEQKILIEISRLITTVNSKSLSNTALTAAMRYIPKSESFDRRGQGKKLYCIIAGSAVIAELP
ncbi:MAG: LemA family protein [Nostoc sp. NMS2]|uniref:LemA family protein n=1 Tax=Nostoc sp. NMS2 TaxID=2815389 RepID=UPI0025E87CC0|nr:LemA family protein [Nostoc sp. NMS2]MBN3989504.1 LemA family protein [Nostoc sp. NMS2]